MDEDGPVIYSNKKRRVLVKNIEQVYEPARRDKYDTLMYMLANSLDLHPEDLDRMFIVYTMQWEWKKLSNIPGMSFKYK